MDFMDAVKDLAGQAGLEMPARSPEEAERARAVEHVHDVLHRAADWYAAELAKTPVALDIILRHGVSADSVEKFGLRLAPSRRSCAMCGSRAERLGAAGLLISSCARL